VIGIDDIEVNINFHNIGEVTEEDYLRFIRRLLFMEQETIEPFINAGLKVKFENDSLIFYKEFKDITFQIIGDEFEDDMIIEYHLKIIDKRQNKDTLILYMNNDFERMIEIYKTKSLQLLWG